MSFGFDPSIILGARPFDSGQPIDSAQSGAKLGDMLRKQQQEQTLADIYRQNAATPDALPGALMRGGFGQQAFGAQDQAAQMNAQRAQLGKMILEYQEKEQKRIGESFYGVKDQAGWAAARAGVPEQFRGMIPEAYDPAVAQRLGNMAIPAEKRAGLEQDAYGLTSNPVTGSIVRLNKKTGETSSIESGSAQLGSGPLKPKEVEDQFKELTAAVSTVKGKANLNAQNQARLYNSERVKRIATDDNGNIKDLSPAMITDLAAATAALSSNGSPAQSVIEHFLPKGRGMSQASIEEWLTNDPHGAGQMGFVKQMVDLANREEKLITSQMRSGQLQAVPNYAHLKKLNKTRYETILKGAGLDPTAIDDNGLPVTNAAPAWGDADEARLQELERKAGGK